MPSVTGIRTSVSIDQRKATTNTGQITVSGGFSLSVPDIDIQQVASMGRVLVSTDVITPNGITATINSEDHQPILVSGPSGAPTAADQTVETSVTVTPTILSFNPQDPLSSTVKLNIDLGVSLPTGTVSVGKTEAVAYSAKALTTERIVRADGKQVFTGSFVGGAKIKAEDYVPFISKIPLIKYLFSKTTTETSRTVSVLFISVRLVPGH